MLEAVTSGLVRTGTAAADVAASFAALFRAAAKAEAVSGVLLLLMANRLLALLVLMAVLLKPLMACMAARISRNSASACASRGPVPPGDE